MSANVKVVLYTSKILKNGEHPIMLRVIKDRKPKYISIGFSCTKNMWDEKSNLPKKKHPHFTQLRIKINDKINEAQRLVLDLENNQKNLSAHEIKGKLKKKAVNNPLIMEYFDQVVKRLKAAAQIKNAEIYKDTKRNLSHFLNSRQIHFSDIDVQFLNNFEEYLKINGKGGNTIYLYLRTLRALINKAIKEEVCGEQYYAFKKFSLAKYAKIKTEKRAISREDIALIEHVDLSKRPELSLAQKMFLFSFYCRGMNFVDLAYLKWSDISNDRLTYRRQKTKELFTIELLDPAKQILKYFRKLTFGTKENFVFPIFNDNHLSPQSRHNRRIKMLRQINSDLKLISKEAKVEAVLTTYVARHSFATILKKKGVSIAVISQTLGHDSEKTTQTYLEEFENNVIDEAVKAIL